MKNKLSLTTALCLVLSVSACNTKLQPLTDREVVGFINKDSETIKNSRIPATNSITIYDAMAMSLANNLDYRVQVFSQAVAQGQFDISKFDMLPKVTASAGATTRNPGQAAVSKSVLTGQQSLEPSTSEDKNRRTADVSFYWNLIDFGVSYYQSKQEANKVLIEKELRRKALQNLLVQVRNSYWKAAAAQNLKAKVDSVIEQISVALANSKKVEDQKLKPPLEALRSQRSLIDIMREMKTVRDELQKSEIELCQLLNIPFGQKYKLSYESFDIAKIPSLNVGQDRLADLALLNRPELREEIYRTKISYDESKKVLLKLLPGIELKASDAYDSNSYLVNNAWRQASAQITANLVDILTYKTRMGAAKAQESLSDEKRMALQLAIISQVYLAAKDYTNSQEDFTEAHKVSEIDDKIRKIIDISAKNDAEVEFERIKASASAVNTKLKEFQAYANFQNAFGRLVLSIGYDIVDIDENYNDIKSLSETFKRSFESLEANKVSEVIGKFDRIKEVNSSKEIY